LPQQQNTDFHGGVQQNTRIKAHEENNTLNWSIFASIENLFPRNVPSYEKLSFLNSVFGLANTESVSLFRKLYEIGQLLIFRNKLIEVLMIHIVLYAFRIKARRTRELSAEQKFTRDHWRIKQVPPVCGDVSRVFVPACHGYRIFNSE
jgi:hypothetical protein